MPPRTERPRMSDYGVPESPEGLLPWRWAEERLVASRSYWLTTVRPEGRPHSLPVWGVWLADRERFWFFCGSSSRKAQNLRAGPWVVVAPGDTVEVVSVEGRAEETTGGDIDAPVDAYFAKYGEEMGMTRDAVAEFLGSNASFEVTPERAFGIIERAEEFSHSATRWRW